MRHVFTGAGILAILPLLGGCCFSSDFWDRSCVVGGEYGGDRQAQAPVQPRVRTPQRQPDCAPPQAELDPMQPAPDPTPRQQAPRANDPYSPFAARPPQTPRRPSQVSGPTREDMEVLEAVNRIRAQRGLRQLTFNSNLFVAARDHSIEQMRHGYMGHGSPDKSRDQLGERMAIAGYDGRGFAEVVAWGYRNVPAVVEGWMNSRPHRAILLDKDFTEAAFSRAGLYWTGNFGLPRARRAGGARRPSAPSRAAPTPRSQPAPRAQATPRRAPQIPDRYQLQPQPQPRQRSGFG
ncbi:MAG: CAP domain-containing protein [Planctomycetota bacterium]|nr:CAP domain-containing protein [Planctomycetota bacterium]